jgi:RNA polymerase sigma factor (sigma-70 family)
MKEQQPDPDAGLVAAWQAGEVTPESLQELGDRLVRWICGQDRRLRADADDLAAETMERVFRKIATFEGRAKFFTWVIRFAQNVLLEHYKKERMEPPVVQEDGVDSDSPADAEREPLLRAHAADDPEKQAILRLAFQEARECALTPHEREVFRLRWDEELSFKEIGQQLEITDDAAQQTGMRATMKMRRYLKEHGYDCW